MYKIHNTEAYQYPGQHILEQHLKNMIYGYDIRQAQNVEKIASI